MSMLGMKSKLATPLNDIVKGTSNLSLSNSSEGPAAKVSTSLDERSCHKLLTCFLDNNVFKDARKKEFVESARRSRGGVPSTGLDDRRTGNRILRWVYFAKRPLTFKELSDGLYHYPSDTSKGGKSNIEDRKPLMKEEIISLTFCVVDEIDGHVSFRYKSIRDRVESKMLHHEKAVHKEMALACIRYILSVSDGPCMNDVDLRKRREQNPFFDYAASFWAQHASLTVKHGRDYDADLTDAIKELLSNDGAREAAVQAIYTAPHTDTSNRSRFSYSGSYDGYPKLMTPLHLAAYFDLGPIVRSLIHIDNTGSPSKGNVNVDLLQTRNSGMMTPLHVAASAGASGVVKYLIGLKSRSTSNEGHPIRRSKALIDIDDVAESRAHDGGGTALCFAAGNGHYKVCHILLQHGASTTRAWPKTGWNPLVAASRGGHLDCVELLLQNGAMISVRTKKERSALSEAVEGRHMDVLKLLLQHGVGLEMNVPASLNMDSPLQTACEMGDPTIVEMLLDDAVKYKLNMDGGLLLRLAAEKGNVEVLKRLLERKLVKGEDCGPAVYWAAYKGQESVVDQLINFKELDIKTYRNFANGWTSLHAAAHKGDWTGSANIIRKMVAAGVPVDAKSNDGETALHRAAERGHKLNLTALLEAGADPNSRRAGGMTASHLAVICGSADIIEILLHQPTLDLNIRDDKGRTLLHVAAEKEHLSTPAKACFSGWSRMRQEMVFANHETVEMVALSSQGKTILDAIENNSGNTALHTCAITGNAGVAQFLVKYGANIDLTNSNNMTAQQLAETNGFDKVVKALDGEMVEFIGYRWKRRADPKYAVKRRLKAEALDA